VLASGKVIEKQQHVSAAREGIASQQHVDTRIPNARSQIALQVIDIKEVLSDLDPRHDGRGPVEAR